jgi:hypothetical protein
MSSVKRSNIENLRWQGAAEYVSLDIAITPGRSALGSLSTRNGTVNFLLDAERKLAGSASRAGQRGGVSGSECPKSLATLAAAFRSFSLLLIDRRR